MGRDIMYLKTGIFFAILLAGSCRPAVSCTIFKITRDGITLVGNNEDDNNPDTKIWILAPERGKHGLIFFGYNNSVAQGGMNDQGLFFDWVADRPSPDWSRDPHRLNYPGSVSEKILEEAGTVEEALRFYEKYNETAFLKSRTLLVDKTGASAIVSWQEGRVQVTRGKAIQALGYGYGTASSRLEKLGQLSIAAVSEVVEACLQSGEYPTQYSNVYDLSHREVYVYQYHQHKPVVKLNLQKEVLKGHHCYNISELSAQVERPPITDSKTQPIVAIDSAVSATYAGRYLIPPDYILNVSAENGRLFIEAPDTSRMEMYPASPTKFFMRCLDAYLLFNSRENGPVGEVLLHVQGRETTGKRMN
jgi:hypothetical protein